MYQSLNDTQKGRFFNSVLTVIILLAVFLAVNSFLILKEYSYVGSGVYPSNVITVSGKGEVFAIPDTGSFSFSVVEDGATVKVAQDKASKKMNSILDSIKEMGIEDKDIKTIGYYSNPKYEYQQMQEICTKGYCPPGKQVLIGYEVSQTISVKVRKTDKAGEALTKVGSLGVENISGLSFIVDDMDKAEAEARDKAITDAKQKAEILAESLGVKLVKIISFSESGNYPVPYYGMGGMEKSIGMDSVASAPPQLPVGENEIISNINITYEIR